MIVLLGLPIVLWGCDDRGQEHWRVSEECAEPNAPPEPEEFVSRFPKYDTRPKGLTLETFQVKARLVSKSKLYEDADETLDSLLSAGSVESYKKFKALFEAWDDFDDTIYEFEFLSQIELFEYEKGQLFNILITRQDVDREGFTKTVVNVPAFEKGKVVLLTLTPELAFGWEGIEDDYSEGFIGLIGCLRIDPVVGKYSSGVKN